MNICRLSRLDFSCLSSGCKPLQHVQCLLSRSRMSVEDRFPQILYMIRMMDVTGPSTLAKLCSTMKESYFAVEVGDEPGKNPADSY